MSREKFCKKFISIRQSIIEDRFDFLNDKQKEAVLATEGPLLILAGAGSGKTTVLINRILNILKFAGGYDSDFVDERYGDDELRIMAEYLMEPDIDSREAVEKLCKVGSVKPWEILAITFTNKAARELKERLELALGEEGNKVWAFTFHTACLRILRSHIEKLGYSKEFTIYDEDDKKKMIKAIVRGFNLDDKVYDERAVSGIISRSKDNLIGYTRYSEEAGADYYKSNIAKIFREYQLQLKASNALDFDDIIYKTVQLLKQDKEVLEYYKNRFKYVLVDEYQDTNHAQYVLTSLLASGNENICVVGDDDQSIYKFRGATIRNIMEFEKEYKNATVIRLEQNYRSTKNILAAANGIISNNEKRKSKKLWTQNQDGVKIIVNRSENQDEEARYISESIFKACSEGGSFKDFAVLYRTHALSRNIEDAFKRNGIIYKVVGGQKFFDRMEIKDILAYFWLIQNKTDVLRIKRIINVPARKISAKTVEQIDKISFDTEETFYNILENINDYSEISNMAKKAVVNFCDIMDGLRRKSQELSIDLLYDEILADTSYLATLEAKNDDESRGRIENILEFKSYIKGFLERSEDPSISAFLEEIALFTDLDSADSANDFVTVMTMHAAKGLEFPSVFICGMEEDVFPSFRSKETDEDMEEERRLCYVAVTRAKKNLQLTCTERRMIYGQTKYSKPSSFIDEIPSDIVESNIVKIIRGENIGQIPKATSMAYNITMPKKSVETDMPVYTVGEKVKHKAFGIGTITLVKPMSGDILLEIAFDEKGTKKLLAKTANKFMEKVF